MPPVIRFHLNVLSKWLSSADDGWCELGINTYALGWMTRILHSHQARRVLTTDQLSEKYAQLQAIISFELFGGKLSEWFMAVQPLVAEFAALVQTSETHAAANGDSKSNILNGDNTSIGAALKILGGRVYKFFLDEIHSTFPTEYEKVYLQLVRSASPFGPEANLLLRQRHFLGFLSRFEEQYPSMIPQVINALPTALTLHVLIGGDSLSDSPTAAAAVTPAAPSPPPVPSTVSPPPFYGQVCTYCGNGCGKGECLGQLYDAIRNSVEHMSDSYYRELVSRGSTSIGAPFYIITDPAFRLQHRAMTTPAPRPVKVAVIPANRLREGTGTPRSDMPSIMACRA